MPTVIVKKEVPVYVDSRAISQYRKDNPVATAKGPLSVDDNIIQVIADTIATEKIAARGRDVKTSTSFDDMSDLDVRR